MGSGGPAGTLAHVERAAAVRTCLGAARAMGRAMACIFAESGEGDWEEAAGIGWTRDVRPASSNGRETRS